MNLILKPEEEHVLEEARKDARVSIRELATRVGLAETTARDILHRLERKGVITGYRAIIDPKAIGAQARSLVVLTLPDGFDVALLHDDPGVQDLRTLPERPEAVVAWVAAPDDNAMAVKLLNWTTKHGLRIDECHGLCDLDEPVRQDLREESPDAWFTVLKAPAF